jgi:hypothetical protein
LAKTEGWKRVENQRTPVCGSFFSAFPGTHVGLTDNI